MFSIRLSILTTIFFFIMSNYLAAVEVQKETNALVIGQALKINSKILNEERPIWVYLPEDYNVSQDKKYPVLYMLDGAYHFHHITGAVEILAKGGRIPQMIVIAIPYIDYDHRDRDLSPTSENGRPPVAGADNFMAFLEEELIPFADKNYRTNSYKILFGHSRAGLFSIYVLLENPGLFNTFISISPILGWDDRFMFKKFEALYDKKPSFKKTLYFSIADGDPDQYRIPVLDFSELLKKKKPEWLNFNFSFMENENHGSIVHRVFYNNLEDLFSNWRLTTAQIEEMSFEQLKEYYSKLSNVYGYKIQVPSRASLPKAMQLYNSGDEKKAIEIFRFIIDENPNESLAHFMIGVHYANSGKLDLAKEKYETAIKMVDKSDGRYRWYLNNLNQLLKQIEDSKSVEE